MSIIIIITVENGKGIVTSTFIVTTVNINWEKVIFSNYCQYNFFFNFLDVNII